MKSHNSCPQVIGIASGKGGVGKTTVSVNLAVALALRGRKVVLLDADLGMANAQISLGVKTPLNIGHVLRGEKTLQEVMASTPQGSALVTGVSGLREAAALEPAQIGAIIHAFDDFQDPIDYLIVDVAAGISPPVLSFMAACQRRFVVFCDQPSSIADAYGLIKVMTQEEHLDEIYLVPNMVDGALEGKQLFGRMNDVCTRFLGHSVRHIGSIESDELVLTAQRKYKTVLDFAPGSKGAADFRRLAQAVDELPRMEQPNGRLQFFMQRMLHNPTPDR
jgi:flagellar biosynthesis protein FlhG